MNELSVLKLFQLSNGDLLFHSLPKASTKLRKPRMMKLGQDVLRLGHTTPRNFYPFSVREEN